MNAGVHALFQVPCRNTIGKLFVVNEGIVNGLECYVEHQGVVVIEIKLFDDANSFVSVEEGGVFLPVGAVVLGIVVLVGISEVVKNGVPR